MVGAFIGDLASWTWQNDKGNLFPLSNIRGGT